MKHLRSIPAFFLALFVCSAVFAQTENASENLKGTSWFISKVVKTNIQQPDEDPVVNIYEPNESILHLKENHEYAAENFLGVYDSVGGYFSESEHVLTLSTSDRKRYLFVFDVLNKTLDDLELRYVSYKPGREKSVLYLKRYIPVGQPESTEDIFESTEETPEDDTPVFAELGGTWAWSFDDKELSVEITQQGPRIFGKYCYGSACETEYGISGEVTEKGAKVSLFDKTNGKTLALADAELTSTGELRWKMIEKNDDSVKVADGISLQKQ